MNNQQSLTPIADAMQAGWEKALKIGIEHGTQDMMTGRPDSPAGAGKCRMCALGFTFYGALNQFPYDVSRPYVVIEETFPILASNDNKLRNAIFDMNDSQHLSMSEIIQRVRELELILKP